MFSHYVSKVNLCFDQLIFKVSQKIFLHFKKQGSLLILPAEMRAPLEGDGVLARQATESDVPTDCYHAILKQKHYQVMSINFFLSFSSFLSLSFPSSCSFHVERIIVIFTKFFKCNPYIYSY